METEKKFTYYVVFQSNEHSNNKGFKYSLQECKSYIQAYNGSNESYFEDYKGGYVFIFCNETEKLVYQELIF